MTNSVQEQIVHGDSNGVQNATKSTVQADLVSHSSRYWQKRYVPGGDESFEVSHLHDGES
jgi:hypothetical protein